MEWAASEMRSLSAIKIHYARNPHPRSGEVARRWNASLAPRNN